MCVHMNSYLYIYTNYLDHTNYTYLEYTKYTYVYTDTNYV